MLRITWAKLSQQNPDNIAWQPADGNGRWRMTRTGMMLAELPIMNEIIPWYARTALNPYRMDGDKAAVAQVSFLITKTLGFGPNYYSENTRKDDLIYTGQEKMKRMVPAGAAPQFGGFTKMPDEVDTPEPAR